MMGRKNKTPEQEKLFWKIKDWREELWENPNPRLNGLYHFLGNIHKEMSNGREEQNT